MDIFYVHIFTNKLEETWGNIVLRGFVVFFSLGIFTTLLN